MLLLVTGWRPSWQPNDEINHPCGRESEYRPGLVVSFLLGSMYCYRPFVRAPFEMGKGEGDESESTFHQLSQCGI